MDKRTNHSRIQKMFADVPLDAEISFEALKKLILINLSSSPKAPERYIQLMKATGLIEEFEPLKFKVVKNGNL